MTQDHTGHQDDEDGIMAEQEAELRARLASLVSIDLEDVTVCASNAALTGGPAGPSHATTADEDKNKNERNEFAFRLFSTAAPTARVVLTSKEEEDLANAGGGSILAQRPLSFYLRGDVGPEERRRVRLSAVSGRNIIERARRQRVWGMEMPWRVETVVVGRCEGSTLAAAAHDYHRVSQVVAKLQYGAPDGRTKRPGKKGRIALRVRERARKEKEAAEAAQRMTKEEHLRAKKKRLNRLKKTRKRQKAKEQKRLATAEGGAADASVQDDALSSACNKEAHLTT